MADAQHPPEVDRAAASRRAVEARRARASLKKDVAMRVITPQELVRRAFADPTSPAGTMRVTEFLTSIPAIGEGKRDRILDQLGISPVKRLGGLGARQRRAIEAYLDERWPELHPREGRSRLVVLAGPTAVGKGTVAARIAESHPEIHLSISATTRAPRPGELDSEHYYFVDDAEFDRLIGAGELLEHATVHNRFRYGTPRGRSRRPLPKAGPCSSRSICKARGRCARRSRPRRSSSCCPRAGTSSCSGSWVAAPKTQRSARGASAPRRSSSLHSTSSISAS